MAQGLPPEGMAARLRWWLVLRGLLRAAVTAAAMLVLYYMLPLYRRSDVYLYVELTLGVALLVGMVAWQARAILRSDYPGIRAVQALASSAALLLLLFAAAYFILSLNDPATFTEPLSRSDALYFTVTTFATVGYGDITAHKEPGRLVVTGQILLNLVVLGVGIQVLIEAAKRGRASKRSGDSGA